MLGEDARTLSFRGRRSRNKVSVGEPAEGSLSFLHTHHVYCFVPPRNGDLSPFFGTPPLAVTEAEVYLAFPLDATLSLRDIT